MTRDIQLIDLLKPSAISILDDLNNYLAGYELGQKLFCKACEKEIASPQEPLILWSKNQDLCVSFHLECAVKHEKRETFLELMGKFITCMMRRMRMNFEKMKKINIVFVKMFN